MSAWGTFGRRGLRMDPSPRAAERPLDGMSLQKSVFSGAGSDRHLSEALCTRAPEILLKADDVDVVS